MSRHWPNPCTDKSRLSAAAALARPWSGRAAFTLIELIMTIALAGTLLLGLVFAFHEKARLLETDRNARFATILADDLMNEVRSRSFAEPLSPASFGLDAGETASSRAAYDDVDDYNGWIHTPPQTIEGVDLTTFAGFTHRVVVTNVWSTALNAAGVTNLTGFKRITVVVSNRTVSVSNQTVVGAYD
jgi:prepilin-type N-terminal cleavage/methylation domain-containing protein